MRYILLSSKRSGSTFLSYVLRELFKENNDGPDEWIVNAKTRKNLALPDDFNTANNYLLSDLNLLISKMSPQSHRKIMYEHLGDPILLPKNIPVIHLVRRDSWAQAKSIWVMDKGFLSPHLSNDNEKKNNLEIAANKTILISLAKSIKYKKKAWIKGLMNHDHIITIFYEDDVDNEEIFWEQTIFRIANFLNYSPPIDRLDTPFLRTRSFYTFNNMKEYEESKLTSKYYLTDDYLKSSLMCKEDFNYRLQQKFNKWF